MTARADKQILLRTKLHRPRVTSDVVDRPRLIKALNGGLDRPLVLVAAPAGFGKSTLVSVWLETCDLPHAWISLDEADNDLGVFLSYFLGAMQSIFPGELPDTNDLPNGISLPDVGVIARRLLNDLDGLGRDFILVLDDFQFIRDQLVHELLSLLLQHPPQGLHLVIATRLEPRLPLGALRARHQVVEIRGQDLRFSAAEIAEFAQQALGEPLAEDTLAVLEEKTEGWAVGLRLATLALRSSGDVDSRLAGLHAGNRYMIDYLMSEVLSQVPPAMRDFLLKTSILDQMCAPLCQAVIGPDDPDFKPQEYLAWLEQADMFTVTLDSRGEWYRYHHLFRELLQDRLAHQASAGEIATLHSRTSAWYARHGLLEEALQHALLGQDTPGAVHLLAEHRHALMETEQWQLHERVLRKFPAEAVDAHADLTLMAAWIARLGRLTAASSLELVKKTKALVAHMPDQPEHVVHLRGEIDTLRAILICEAAGDPETVIALTHRALATTPRAWYYVRSTAWLYRALAHQMAGRLDRAYAALAEGEPEDVAQNGAVRARVAGSRCFVEWIAADLLAIPRGAAYLVTVGETHQRRESLAWAHYLLGCAAYERNDLLAAEAHARAVEGMRYAGRPMIYLQSAFLSALVWQAHGQPDQAQRQIELAFDFLRETRSEGLLPLAQAFQAELAVMQGDLHSTRHWATTIGPYLPLSLMPYFHTPQLTLPKILLAQDTPSSREQAGQVLTRLHAFVTAIHNTRVTIEVLALQALLHDAQGDEQAALASLQQAVSLAEPGGFIRLFVDLGPRLASLTARLRQTSILPAYTAQILQAFGECIPAVPRPQAAVSPMGQLELVEPLTEREHDVLMLLAQRLTAKEIAQALVISHLTVKRHLSNIYSKLQVSGRRDAVAKADRLGLL